MQAVVHLFQTEPVLAFLIATLIFLVTIFLAVKQWIGFSITLLLLVFSLTAGLFINNQKTIQSYAQDYHQMRLQDSEQDAFKKQIMQAVEDLKNEVDSEKENLRQVVTQVQTIFEQVETQKQKLQHFIEETKDQFKTDDAIPLKAGTSSSNPS